MSEPVLPTVPEEPPPPKRQPYRWGWRQYLALAVIAATVALLRIYVVESDIVQGASMEPALQPGDYVLVCKLAYRNGQLPARNEVVTFTSPVHPGEVLVKRVVGLPGDAIQYQGLLVLINGALIGPLAVPLPPGLALPEYVPPGHVYVVGDNRANSEDSRDWGPIEVSALRGRAVLVYLPPGRSGLVR